MWHFLIKRPICVDVVYLKFHSIEKVQANYSYLLHVNWNHKHTTKSSNVAFLRKQLSWSTHTESLCLQHSALPFLRYTQATTTETRTMQLHDLLTRRNNFARGNPQGNNGDGFTNISILVIDNYNNLSG